MSNWLDERFKQNREIADRIIPELQEVKRRYPQDEKEIDKIIEKLDSLIFSQNIFFEIGNWLQSIVGIDETFFRNKSLSIWELRKKLQKMEADYCGNAGDPYIPVTDSFAFKQGRNHYYLRLPMLKVRLQKGAKSENMTGRYVSSFLMHSLIEYEQNIGKQLTKFDEFTIVFIHHLTKERAKVFDTDNIDISHAINGINGILIENDCAFMMDVMQIVKFDEEEFTEMHIIRGREFGENIISALSA